MPALYTPSEVSKLLDITPSTLRRWSSIFEGFLSPSAKVRGRKRMYTQEDLYLITEIRDLAARNVSLENIANQVGRAIVIPETERTELTLPGLMREHRDILDRIKQLEGDRHADRGELRELRERMEKLERYYSEPWYRRIFKKPPE